jgi:modification methylase
MIKPGEALFDAKRRWKALVRADGAISFGETVGSIHRIGAVAQGLDACNGWSFWHVERDKKLLSIDGFRAEIRENLAQAAE